MARVLMLLALCVLPAIVSANQPMGNPFFVRGCVYCDPCRAGFETSLTSYIHGARVRIECKDSKSLQLKYSKMGTTDSEGKYEIMVEEDHEDQICDVVLVSSPHTDCALPDSGRNRSRVPITRYNGLITNNRFANAMGFMKDQPLSGCTKVLQQYLESD